ncbi:MAG TPA: ABC transporter permease subunit, partial [Candidatus Thermoplasmatota archaeon]|nr:ABC transporter permease subunit [Candidatus Thermoplasmatota archaeon]
MRALVAKELQELARERRFAAFLVAFSAILGAGSAVVLHAAEESRAAGGIGVGFADPVFGLLFVGLVSCVLLALTFAADAVAKERDQGMLPLLLTAPVTHAQVLGAKAVALAVVYAGYALVNLAIAAILAAAFGLVVLKATFWLLLLPLGAFYVFLCGTCLLLSALFRSSKAAVATPV